MPAPGVRGLPGLLGQSGPLSGLALLLPLPSCDLEMTYGQSRRGWGHQVLMVYLSYLTRLPSFCQPVVPSEPAFSQCTHLAQRHPTCTVHTSAMGLPGSWLSLRGRCAAMSSLALEDLPRCVCVCQRPSLLLGLPSPAPPSHAAPSPADLMTTSLRRASLLPSSATCGQKAGMPVHDGMPLLRHPQEAQW